MAIVVGFDREIFLHQLYGGVSRGFASLISEFLSKEKYGISPQVLFSKSSNYYVQRLFPDMNPARRFLKSNSGWSTLLSYGVTRELSSRWAGGKNPNSTVDILHATYYRPSLLDRISAKRLTMTIHDFIPEQLGWTGFRNPHIGKLTLCKKADLIFCVSHTTRNELLQRCKIPEDRVRVIHQGVYPAEIDTLKKDLKSNPYLLFVGHRDGYKNFDLFIDAFSKVSNRYPDLKLVVVGPPLTTLEFELLDKALTSGNWIALPPQTDDQLADIYRSAFAHVVASSMEGFGMTILESMAQGTPVILNDISVFNEVAGRAGVYFTPSAPDSFAAALDFLSIEANYEKMSKLSVERSLHFSWERSALLHAAAYRDLI